MERWTARSVLFTFLLFLTLSLQSLQADPSEAIFNILDYGATGHKDDDARPAIQSAIDLCAAAGGGTVYVPPGEYTSGQIRLRSYVRLYIEAGATVFVSKNSRVFDQGQTATFIYGEDLQKISIEGRGTIDGQSEYEWRLSEFDDAYIRPNQLLMTALGKPLMRPFPSGHPKETIFPRMVLLIRCKDVRIAGLSFIRSRSWNINPYACERVIIDGIYINSSLKEGVWADGIDPDGCKDVRISNSTIETGDDAIVFYSSNAWGPALACENITVTNCRLSSASSALKFCDGNMVSIRKVAVDNCVITTSNRGIAFMVFNQGYVSDVVLSNLVVECVRFDWFWWGDGDPIHFDIKRISEIDPKRPREKDPPVGAIRNVLIRNVIARGQGSCRINGHPESWLDGLSVENVKLFLSADPTAYAEKAVHAMDFRWARDLKLRDVEVVWDKPASEKWRSALYLEDVQGLDLDGFAGRPAQAGTETPVVVLNQVQDAVIRSSKPREGSSLFLQVSGDKSRGIVLTGNDLRKSKTPYRLDANVKSNEVTALNNITATP
jgi:polygalacturonase